MGALRDSIITTLIVKFFLKYATPYPTHLIIGILLVYSAYFQFHLKPLMIAIGDGQTTKI